MATRIKGYCPMGCGPTLMLRADLRIACSDINCPRLGAVTEILGDQETEHRVTFDEQGFTVRHPLRERLDDALMRCDLHRFCAEMPGPPELPGLYRAFLVGGQWTFDGPFETGLDRGE